MSENRDSPRPMNPRHPVWPWFLGAVLLTSVVVSNGLWWQSPFITLAGGGWKYGVLWANIVLLAGTASSVGQGLKQFFGGKQTWRRWFASATAATVASLALLVFL